jgi:hypothetical protein
MRDGKELLIVVQIQLLKPSTKVAKIIDISAADDNDDIAAAMTNAAAAAAGRKQC